MTAFRRTRIAVVVLAVASLAMMLRAGDGGIALVPFAFWVLLPFIATYRMLDEAASRLFGIVGLLAALLATAGYIAIALPLGRRSSTAGLGFLFFPVWHWLSLGVALGIGRARDWWMSRTRGRDGG